MGSEGEVACEGPIDEGVKDGGGYEGGEEVEGSREG